MTDERRRAIAAMHEKRRVHIEAHIDECLSIYAMMREQLPNMDHDELLRMVSAVVISLATADAAETTSDRVGRVERSIDEIHQSMASRR